VGPLGQRHRRGRLRRGASDSDPTARVESRRRGAGCGWRWAGGAGLRWAEARGAGKPGREDGGAAADFSLTGLHAKPGRNRGRVKEEKENGLAFWQRGFKQ
jgi:hypothetical protein